MSALRPATHYVLMDEPALNLSEVNLVSPDGKGWQRVQVITVIRNDAPAEYREVLGPASAFKANQFRIPGGFVDEFTGRIYIEHTVGELRDIADYLRAFPYDTSHIVPTDLVKKWHDELEQKQAARKGRVQFAISSHWR